MSETETETCLLNMFVDSVVWRPGETETCLLNVFVDSVV